MPVAGPPLIHDFGPDLRLKKNGCLAYDFEDRAHPDVFIPGQKLRIIQHETQQIALFNRSCRPGTDEMRLQLRITPFRLTEEGLLALFAIRFQAVIVAINLLDIFAD